MSRKKLSDAAEDLILATHKREFERSPDLRKTKHDREANRLKQALRDECTRLEKLLQPLYVVSCADGRVELFDSKHQDRYLVALALNVSNVGEASVQLFSRQQNADSRPAAVRLERSGRDQFRWTVGGEQLSSKELAEYFLVQLVDYAKHHLADR